jgi:uncharacterized protein
VDIPPLTRRVSDLAGTLSIEQAAVLERKLAAFEATKGAQVAVLILPTTQPETIEQFGIRLFDAWKIGRKGVDDGVILIVAKDDRRLRIEVGYGLEGVLNDATVKRIIADTIAPRFKAGDIPDGVLAGVEAILKTLAGEPLPAVAQPSGAALPGFAAISESVLFALLLVSIVGGTILRRLLGNLLGSAVLGSLTGFAGWLIVGGVTGAIVGVLAGLFLAVFGRDILLSGILNGGRGGGVGGGGFRGGGGTGGGGGASGSW